MARSPIKAASESGVNPAAEEVLRDFDDVTLRGELKHALLSRGCFV